MFVSTYQVIFQFQGKKIGRTIFSTCGTVRKDKISELTYQLLGCDMEIKKQHVPAKAGPDRRYH